MYRILQNLLGPPVSCSLFSIPLLTPGSAPLPTSNLNPGCNPELDVDNYKPGRLMDLFGYSD